MFSTPVMGIRQASPGKADAGKSLLRARGHQVTGSAPPVSSGVLSAVEELTKEHSLSSFDCGKAFQALLSAYFCYPHAMGSNASNSAEELARLDLAEASRLVQTRAVSPVELTRVCLDRIERLDPILKSFITVTAESALREARQAESEISKGNWKGPLHGIPLAVKDLLETASVRTTAASAVLQDYVPEHDAYVVQRLRSAGAVLLGKLNLHEFAYGGSSMISHFGIVRNPWDIARITGGSSSGSASAVAAGLCYGAIGSDTAGSIRLPASCCGITGLKPTYGLVSARGVIPLSWSYDHVGPMTRTVADAALLLQVIASYDPQDFYCQKFPPVHYPKAIKEKTASLRLGVARDFWKEVDQEVKSTVDAAVNVLGQLTAGTEEISLSTETDRTVMRCESFVFHQKYLPQREDKYHPETLRRIRTGADVTAAQYVENYRELLRSRRDVLKIFDHIDLIVTPTCPILPPTIAELEAAPQDLRKKELVMLRNTRPFNGLGLPAISIPCGFSRSGLPIGLQIAGAPGAEDKVLALAHAYQHETDWHKRRPKIG
jgi:aspartyl-tRNA(Asn)/glutamyl-tRNA(Gln) amidotransferase subunit A